MEALYLTAWQKSHIEWLLDFGLLLIECRLDGDRVHVLFYVPWKLSRVRYSLDGKGIVSIEEFPVSG